MVLARPLVALLLQAAARPDTVIARTIPQRDWLDWTNDVLQLLVLVLATCAIIALIMLFLAMRDGIRRLSTTVDSLASQARPMLTTANAMVSDARSMVAMVRTDVERVTDAAGAISDQLLDAAEVTAQRVDEVNAVLDVLQTELEDTMLSTAASIRGVRVGAQALASGLLAGRPPRGGRSRRRESPPAPPTHDQAPASDVLDD